MPVRRTPVKPKTTKTKAKAKKVEVLKKVLDKKATKPSFRLDHARFRKMGLNIPDVDVY